MVEWVSQRRMMTSRRIWPMFEGTIFSSVAIKPMMNATERLEEAGHTAKKNNRILWMRR
jgi:hypothetical protein